MASPEVRISGPEYASVSQGMSDDDAPEIRQGKRSRFEENLDPGLGIQMMPMASPKPPDFTHYHQDANAAKAGMFSPMPSPGPRPLFARTPDTLYSFGSTRTRTDPMTERLIAHRATQSTQWHIHWRVPALIAFAFFMGVVFAMLQHFLYSYLHHLAIDNEGKRFRSVLYGRALAYLSKIAFGACVITVFRQRIWRTFRERAMSVLSIDQLFGATEDPSLITNLETWSNAPVLVIMVMVLWLIPLATVIFSPGALTYGSYLAQETLELTVPTLNFSAESTANYRTPTPIPGVPDESRLSVMYYNTTDTTATKPGWFDYYDQPSAIFTRIANLLAYSGTDQPTFAVDARQNVCGGAYNCTYEQTFVGPGYQCSEVASGYGDPGRLKEFDAPFNTSVLVPEGSNVYYTEVNLGDYVRPQAGQFLPGNGGIPVGDPDPSLGIFKSEPFLWIGFSVNSTVALSQNDSLAQNWTTRYDPKIVRCVHMETRYTVAWNYTDPSFQRTILKQEYLTPIVDTNLTLGDNGLPDNSTEPKPEENWISPRNDVGLYKKTAAYHAIGAEFRTFLTGHISMVPPIPGPTYTLEYSDFTKTRLAQPNGEPLANLTEEIGAFYADMVLSLFSNPYMLVNGEEKITVNRSWYQSAYNYQPVRLWQCYAPVIFVTLLIMLFGFLTIWQDGTTFSTGFSRILVTTRNTTLDDISRGACLGNDPFPMELMHTRLKFGVLSGGNEIQYEGYQGVAHCAFGVASEVGPIIRGVPYAGLPDAGLKRRAKRYDPEIEEMD